MADPKPVSFAPIETPPPRPISAQLSIAPVARSDFNYLSGSAAGVSAAYNSLYSFVWWAVASPESRVRSSVAETVGDILAGVTAVDASAGEAFLERNLKLGSALEYFDALNPDTPTHTFYPRTKNAEVALDSYQYETLLARLSRTYPPSLMVKALDIKDELGFSSYAPSDFEISAQQALKYIFQTWADLYDWFTFTLPGELQIRIPREGLLKYESLTTEAILITQPSKDDVTQSPRSMRDIIDEFLAIFEGHVLRVNNANQIEIVAPYWSVYAPYIPLTLARSDLFTLPSPELDGSSVVNHVTVSSKGFTFVGDGVDNPYPEVMEPSWAEIHDWQPDVDDIPAPSGGGYVEIQQYGPWEYSDNTLIGGVFLEVTIKAQFYRQDGGSTNIDPEGSEHTANIVLQRGIMNSATLTQDFDVFVANRSSTLTVELTWQDNEVYVFFYYETQNHNGEGTGWRFKLNGFGAKFQRDEAAITGIFGETRDYPESAGLSDSQAQFGVVKSRLSSQIFPLTVEQCKQVAQAKVETLKNPHERYALEQAYGSGYKVRPGDIGKQITLPNGKKGVLESWQYSDAFEYDGAFLSSSIGVVVTDNLLSYQVGAATTTDSGAPGFPLGLAYILEAT